ncbi:unnamed protein product [Vitrella brassicaformis CCMP3155]|uniref:Cyclin-dependent kinase 2 homolog n=1 Tax=Vitrella brassicaformis (strain CCMP3155) TaxID=1169540 RepID=A0A0G4ET13_VITBC|nr:unnamed protein product [Vitrella brassicaformis CCMP3155]|eukprot:CEM01556.1 unnamed protein product [Vitrella brassicaformis CCMP3155]
MRGRLKTVESKVKGKDIAVQVKAQMLKDSGRQAEGEGPAAALDNEHMYLTRPNTMASPHVVTPLTYYFEVDDEHGYLVLPDCGEDLAIHTANLAMGPPLAECRDIARQGLQGFQAMHQDGVTHNDVKKQNLTRDAQGHLHVIDLGCAKDDQVPPDDAVDHNMYPTATRPTEMRLRERPYGPKGDVQAYIQALMELRAGLYPFVQWVDQACNVYEDGSDAAALEGMMGIFGAPSNGLFWPQDAQGRVQQRFTNSLTESRVGRGENTPVRHDM